MARSVLFPLDIELSASDAEKLAFLTENAASYMRDLLTERLDAVAICECGTCEARFITGHTTGRRGDAKYCSDKCRVAAMRVRQKLVCS